MVSEIYAAKTICATFIFFLPSMGTSVHCHTAYSFLHVWNISDFFGGTSVYSPASSPFHCNPRKQMLQSASIHSPILSNRHPQISQSARCKTKDLYCNHPSTILEDTKMDFKMESLHSIVKTTILQV